MLRAENDFVRNRVAQRVGRVQKCFTSKLCLLMCRFFLFSSIDLLKTSIVLKKYFNPTGWEGGTK